MDGERVNFRSQTVGGEEVFPLRTTILVLSAAFLGAAFAGSALAAEGRNEGGKTAGHGSAGSSAPAEAVSSTNNTNTEETPENIDRSLGSGPAFSLNKRFKFELGWETHSMLVNNSFAGDGSVGTGGAAVYFNYWYAGATYYLTPNDKISATMGLYLYHLYDPGEPGGFSADDGLLRYTHHFTLPWKLGLDLSASVTAPFSVLSNRMGLITEPQARAVLTRTFAKYISVDVRGYASYYWQQYSTMIGGSTPNPFARFGGRLNVEAQLPYHPALALGVDAETGYTGFYQPSGGPLSTPGVPGATGLGPYYGLETNPIYGSQPWQQDYGVDVYLKYDLPKFYGIKAEAVLAYAQGDPTAGYTSDLVDGMSNLYLFYPEASQVYFSLDLTY